MNVFCNPNNLCDRCPLNEVDPERRAEYSQAVNNVLSASDPNLFVHGEHEGRLDAIYEHSGLSDETLSQPDSHYIRVEIMGQLVARGLCVVAGRNPLGRIFEEAELNE